MDLIKDCNENNDSDLTDSEFDSGYVVGISDSELEDEHDKEAGVDRTDDHWEVEKVLDYSKDSGIHLYLVKWKDWECDFNTWEPFDNLKGCAGELYEFYLERKRKYEEVMKESSIKIYSNGKKRRRGPPLNFEVPPDPRSITTRAQEFYEATRFPNSAERKHCRSVWKKLQSNKKLIPDWKWTSVKVERYLDFGCRRKLNSDEQTELRLQLLYIKFEECHARVAKSLKIWEKNINKTTGGIPKIRVENDVDMAGPPSDFKYINDYIPGEGIKIPDDPPYGCSCTDCFQSKKTCCASELNFDFAYTTSKRLKVSVGFPIYECNKMCKCGPECPNRVVQDGRENAKDLSLCIFRTSDGRGWGVRTLKSIKRGTFVSLYVGEVIKAEEAEKRCRENDDDNNCSYLFNLDFNEGDSFPYAVDAAKYGNLSHFLNHSCDPNLAVFAVWVNCLDPNLPKLALFTIKDIQRNQELTFDYKTQTSNNSMDGEIPNPNLKQKLCLCGSSDCRKIFFS